MQELVVGERTAGARPELVRRATPRAAWATGAGDAQVEHGEVRKASLGRRDVLGHRHILGGSPVAWCSGPSSSTWNDTSRLMMTLPS